MMCEYDDDGFDAEAEQSWYLETELMQLSAMDVADPEDYMEFDTTKHPDNRRWRRNVRVTIEPHELPVKPGELTEMRFYAQGVADALNKPIFLWVNNDPKNTMACGDVLPDDDRSYAILRVIHPNKDTPL